MEISQSSSPVPGKKCSRDPKNQTRLETPPAPPPRVSKARPQPLRLPPFPGAHHVPSLSAHHRSFSQTKTSTPLQPKAGRHTLSCPAANSTPNTLSTQAPQVCRRALLSPPIPMLTHVAHAASPPPNPPTHTPLPRNTHTSSLGALETSRERVPTPSVLSSREKWVGGSCDPPRRADRRGEPCRRGGPAVIGWRCGRCASPVRPASGSAFNTNQPEGLLLPAINNSAE